MPKRAILPVLSTIVVSLVYFGTINNQRRIARTEVQEMHLKYVRDEINRIDRLKIPPDSIGYYKGYRACLSQLTDTLVVTIKR